MSPSQAAVTPLDPANTAKTTSTLSYVWTLVAGASYTAVISAEEAFATPVSSTVLTSNSTTYANLNLGTSYYFEVKLATEGDSSYSAVLTTRTRLAQAPLSAAGNGVVSVTSSTIQVHWTVSNPNPIGTLYKVSYASHTIPPEDYALYTTATSTPLTGLLADTTYFFHVHTIDVDDTEIAADITLSTKTAPPAPLNDNFANAVLVTGFSFNHSTNTTLATIDFSSTPISETFPSCGTGHVKSVWYKYISTAVLAVQVNTVGSDYDTVLQVSSGGTGGYSTLLPIACDDESGGSNTSQTSFTAKSNTTYYFQITQWNNGPGGNLQFNFNASPASAGDVTPPSLAILQPSSGSYLSNLTLISGTAQDASNIVDVQVRISSSCQAYPCIGSGDRDWNGSVWVSTPFFRTANLYSPNSSTTTWDLTGSFPAWEDTKSYYVLARARDSNGNYSDLTFSSFTFSVPTAPSNDDSVNSVIISSVPGLAMVQTDTSKDNINAIYALEKTPLCMGGNRDIWWSYYSTNTVAVELNTFGSNFDTVLAVWKGLTGPTTEAACNDQFNGNQSKVTLTLDDETTYYFQVFSWSGSNGGNVNFTFKALSSTGAAPAGVTNLTASADVSTGSIKLQWTAVGDDGYSGTASLYDVRYSLAGPINDEATFSTATSISYPPTYASVSAPQVSGSTETLFISNLPGNTTVWFALKVKDSDLNASPLSNSATVQVPGSASNATNISPPTVSTISVVPFSSDLNTLAVGGSLERSDISCTGAALSKISGADDVWYRHVATQTVTAVAHTLSSDYDTILMVWSSTENKFDGSDLLPLACSDDESGYGQRSKASFNMSAGSTYYFQVIAAYGAGGSLKFRFGASENQSPGLITSLAAVTGSQNGEVNLAWTAPADNGYDSASGSVMEYQIRYSSSGSINLNNWTPNGTSTGAVRDINSTPIYQIPPAPTAPGTIQNYTVRNLNQGATYWFSIRALDSAGNTANPSNSPYSAARAPSALATDGQGTVQLRDVSGNNVLTEVPVSSQVTVNIRFTVGSSTITGGGKISVRIPDQWYLPVLTPSMPGSVTLSTITPSAQWNQLSLSISGTQDVVVTVSTSGKLNSGDVINIRYSNAYTPYQKQTGVQFLTKSRGSSSGLLTAIPSQPSLNIVSGAPTQIGFTEWNTITLGSGQVSPAILIEPKDNSWQGTAAHKDLKLRIYTLFWDTITYTYRVDHNAQVSKQSPFVAISSVIVDAGSSNSWSPVVSAGATYYYPLTIPIPIPTGASLQEVYYKTTTLGDAVLWIEYNDDFDVGFSTYATSRWLKVRSGSIGIQSIAVTPATISPDNNGSADYASISFNPTASDMNWRVRIGTDPVLSHLGSIANLNIGGGFAGAAGAAAVSVSTINVFMDWWGYGQPQGVTWYGNDFSGGAVPNGAYIVRVEEVSGAAISTTALTVSAGFLDVIVRRGTTSVEGVVVSASGQSGTNGFVNRQVKTGPNGQARIHGLNAGKTYNLSGSYYDSALQKNFNFTKQSTNTAATAPSGLELCDFNDPVQIKIRAVIPADSVQNWDQWGWANVTDANSFFPAGYGSLRVQAGNLESDSGWSPTGFPSSWTVINVSPGSYRIRAEMSGFGAQEFATGNLAGGSIYELAVSFIKKPKVFGYVILPSTQQFGTWVSVEGTKGTDRYPTIWGGAWIPGANDGVARTTGAYILDADSQTYKITARAFGLGSVSLTTTVPTAGIGNLQSGDVWSGNAVIQNGLNFSFGNVTPGVTGYVNVVGDTTGSDIPGGPTSFTMYINAVSGVNYSYSYAQVQLDRNAASTSGTYQLRGLDDGIYQVYTYLQGFETDPPGPKYVTVTGGVGNLNLTLKKHTGRLAVIMNISPETNFSSVSLTVNGPVSFSSGSIYSGNSIFTSVTASTGQVLISGLGTGFYDVEAFFKANGQSKSKVVNVVNGQTSTVTFQLTGQVFNVTGTVKVEPFTLGQTAASTGTRIATIEDLADKSRIGFEQVFIGSGTFGLPIARIEAYPRDERNFDEGVVNRVDVGGGGGVIGGAGVGSSARLGFGQVRFSSITSRGTWEIKNLPPGVYILGHPVNLDPGTAYNTAIGANFETNAADVSNEQKVILIKTDGAVQVLDPPGGNLEFTYAAGAAISGLIKLPSDIPSDTRFLSVILQNSRKEVVNWQGIYMNGSQAGYSIPSIGNGDYTILIQDERKGNQTNPDQNVAGENFVKYVAKPLTVSVKGGNLTGQDIQLERAGYMEGKLAIVRISSDGTKSSELISQNNRNLLPENFQVFPFGEGLGRFAAGSLVTDCPAAAAGGPTPCPPFIDSTKGTFLITGVYPNRDYEVLFKQSSFGSDILGKGQLNLVPVTKSGLTVSPGQTLDMGTVDLTLGLTIGGSVTGPASDTDPAIVPVKNLRIAVYPAGSIGGDAAVTTYSDSKGSFTLSGLDSDVRFYDVVFGERDFAEQFILFAGVEKRYAQKVKRNTDVRITSVPLNAQLELGLASITGTITTPDGGSLRDPFEDGFPVAEIIANRQGEIPSRTPLGDITIRTALDGTYAIDRLAAGSYDIYALSLGYGVGRASVTVTNTQAVVNIQLSTGVSLSGEIFKPDGTKPSQEDMDAFIVATQDFSELVIASLNLNSQTGTIESYTLAGLKSGITYYPIFLDEENNVNVPPEGANGISITTDTANFNLTFAQSRPDVLLKGKKTGVKVGVLDQYRFEMELTQALRNKTLREKADDFWTDVVTVNGALTQGGAGAISADPNDTNPISPNRKKLSFLYVPAADTTKLVFDFDAYSDSLDPGTTQNFRMQRQFEFFLGLEGQKISKINMARGGKIAIEGDQTETLIPAGAFKDAAGNDLSVSTSVSVGMQKASLVETATAAAKAAPGFIPQGSNLPPALAGAMGAMREIQQKQREEAQAKAAAKGLMGAAQLNSDVAASVLGAFYDIFLPAGVNRTLKKNATVTLAYSTSGVADGNINVYFYNDTADTMTATGGTAVPPGAYGLEETNKSINTSNNTISVETNHFTVFVVVNSNQSVLTGAVTTVTDETATSAAFNNSGVNQVTLQKGTTFTYTGITVSGDASENHAFTLISTGAASAGIIVNIQSHLQTFSLALNQEQLVDVNDDNLSDISFKVLSVHPSSAVASIAGLSGISLPDTVDYAGTEILAFNFPNPFDATVRGFLFSGGKTVGKQTLRAEGATAIRYALPSNLGAAPVRVSLEVFDVAGDLVRRLDFGSRATGKYHYGDWDGKNESGNTVASGVYIGRLKVHGQDRSRIFKMAVIK